MQIPKELKFAPYTKLYEPPPPTPLDIERTPEVIEVEMKALEEALDQLILITLKYVPSRIADATKIARSRRVKRAVNRLSSSTIKAEMKVREKKIGLFSRK